MTLYDEGSNASSTNQESDLSQSSREQRTYSSEGEETQCSEGSGMLIGDPLGEGSNTNSTDNELWKAENSLL